MGKVGDFLVTGLLNQSHSSVHGQSCPIREILCTVDFIITRRDRPIYLVHKNSKENLCFVSSPVTYQTRISIIMNVRFEVFTAVTMKNAVFWDVAPYRFCVNRRSHKKRQYSYYYYGYSLVDIIRQRNRF
jgi:hypothetical protein